MPTPHNVVRQPVGQVRPMGALPMPTPHAVTPRPQPYRAVPESRRAPIIQKHPAPVMHTAPTPRGNAYAYGHSQMRGNGGGNSGHAFTGGGGRSFGGGARAGGGGNGNGGRHGGGGGRRG